MADTKNGIYIDDSTEEVDEALQELINQYNALGSGYTAKTQDEIQAQAENEYGSYYDALRRSATQSNETNDLALQQQKEALQATYDKQRQSTAEEYANTYSQAGREQLSKGMQRSSYGLQTLANINTKAAEAQNTINSEQTAAENNVEQQRQQLAAQLAETLSGYDAEEAQAVLARIQELQDTEYDRSVTASNTRNSLAAQIYEYMANKKQQDAEQAQWQAEFDENVRQFNEQLAENQRQFDASLAASGSSGGSNSSSSSTTTASTTAGAATEQAGSDWASVYEQLYGTSASGEKVTTAPYSVQNVQKLLSAGTGTNVTTSQATAFILAKKYGTTSASSEGTSGLTAREKALINSVGEKLKSTKTK